jgi:hypothetical protein
MVRRLLLPVLLALVCAPSAFAAGGNYGFDGGTRAQREQVRAALNASSFDWDVVPGRVTIHIGDGQGPHATPGDIWIDGSLLDAGRFSWGVVQHEYAHQVDFALVTDEMRAKLAPLLGGGPWWGGAVHDDLGCERFADAVAWVFWPSSSNVLKPERPLSDRFRSTLVSLLQGAGVRTTASVAPKRHHPNG